MEKGTRDDFRAFKTLSKVKPMCFRGKIQRR